MIPRGWSLRTFGECARRVTRRVDPRTLPGTPYVGLEHIGVGTLRLLGTSDCSVMTSPSLRVEPGEVIFGRLRPYFRKVVRAPTRLVCTGEAWVLAPGPGVDPRFLFYLAADPSFVDACAAASKGTRMPRADWGFAATRPVALPPLDEQRRIAALLGALDDRIDLHHRMNQTLEEMVRVLFRSWFVDVHGDPAGRLPRGWESGGIDAVADLVRDPVEPDGVPGDTPYVGLEHLPRRRVALDHWGRASEVGSTKSRFRRGDILFGKLRPVFHKVVPAPVDGLCSTDVLVIRPGEEVWRWFAFGHLHSDAMVAHATAASDGTRMPRTHWRDLCRFPVAIPPRELAARYHRAVEPLFERIRANVFASRTLADLRDTLLPRLLSGEIRVPPDGDVHSLPPVESVSSPSL